MVEPGGAVRAHWRAVASAFAAAGRREIGRRTQEARRLIRDGDAAFHVRRRGGARERPWPLDLFPCVLDGEEWARLERAVAQRARLLDAVLGDLYGPRRLIRGGVLPPDWLHANPAFLRGCHGLAPPGGRWLHVYAADLVRSPDGRWRVLNDRTETPDGLGFAIENRMVVDAVAPDLLAASKVRSPAAAFDAFKRSLAASAPGRRENPRIAVLTPGPASGNCFEHAFLARCLGGALVEGADLAVRDYRVHVKTLSGLQQVDLILRGQPSEACDPLEFGGSSAGGVAGLVEAARRGAVAVVNPPGAGAVQSPALMAFLPALCRRLLNAELALPSVATWWCGDDAARAHVLDHLGELVIKPAYPRGVPGEPREPVCGEEVARRPHRYVAQEPAAPSTTPVRAAGGFGFFPGSLVIRVYALAHGGGYDVLPGGLGRNSPSTEGYGYSFDPYAHRRGSMDVWVVGETAAPHRPLIPAGASPAAAGRAASDLPSRIADDLYWLGRYAERVGAAVRLARAAMPLVSEGPSPRTAAALTGALNCLTNLGYAPRGADPDGLLPARTFQAISAMLSESGRHGSLRWQVKRLRNAARRLRDRLPADSWRIVRRLEWGPRPGRSGRRERGVRHVLDRMVMVLTSFSGAVSEGMTRGHEWRLLDFGRRLERALQVIQLLRHGLTAAADDERAGVELLLDATDSAVACRSRHLTAPCARPVVDLLLLDDAHPRSAAFQIDRLERHVARLPALPAAGRTSPESKLITAAAAAVRLVDLDDLCAVRDGRRPALAALLDRLQADLTGLSDALSRDRLAHAAPGRPPANR